MLTQTFADFGLRPNVSLNVMAPNQRLSGLSSVLFKEIGEFLTAYRPDVVLVQGDTTTVQVASLASFYASIPVGHIEAGLRTWNITTPFPEELNRRVTGMVSRRHFAPTISARRNLLRDAVPDEQIVVTGNTVVDALLMTLESIRANRPALPARVEEAIARKRDIILVTGHRRESFGRGKSPVRQRARGPGRRRLRTRKPSARHFVPRRFAP